MHLLHLLLALHVSATAALLLLLSLVVLGQRVRGVVTARRTRRAPAAPASSAAQPAPLPATGASVVDWTIDLRGVGQREAALRT